ncbi:MAG: hypothetical protein J7J46_04660, partial [Candidatus Desulfofervidus sp.]|nr:hypothetical protein [Candidatus Desulfofervidus sp.]
MSTLEVAIISHRANLSADRPKGHFYLSTLSIALSQQHPFTFIGFISSFVFAEVHIHSENTLNQL